MTTIKTAVEFSQAPTEFIKCILDEALNESQAKVILECYILFHIPIEKKLIQPLVHNICLFPPDDSDQYTVTIDL